jgi:hypothetical protein
LTVLTGNGDGTFGVPFQSPLRFSTGGNDPFGVAAADLNGDGLVDLVATNTSSSTVGVLLNTSTALASAGTTTTTLGTSSPTAEFGQTVLLTASVSSQAGVPVGTVTFLDGTTVLGTAPVNAAGQATLGVSLDVGSHALAASFAGARGFGFTDSTSAAVTETVNQAATTVALASSVNPAVTGQAVTFTATVSAVAPGAATPIGKVVFMDGNVVLETVGTGDNGTATFTTSFAVAGSHVITAVFPGGVLSFLASSQSLTEQVNSATTGLQQGGFETPNVGTGAFAYDPAGSAWTFSGLAGVAGNGSGFTSGNPNAPEGTQVAFLQGTGSFSQSVNLTAGTYSLSFAAAQRGNFQASSQTFQVLVDGVSVGTFRPAGTGYGALTTGNFAVATGTHTILFVGLNPNGGDNTAFIDNLQLLSN